VRQMFGCVPVVVQSVSAEHAFITHMPDASPVPQEVSGIMDEQSASALQEGWQTLPISVLQISLVPPQSPLLWHDVGDPSPDGEGDGSYMGEGDGSPPYPC